MLDINFIRENREEVERAVKEKRYKIDLNEILKTDDDRRKILKEVEDLRREKNETATKMKGGKPSPELIKKGKEIKKELTEKEKKLSELDSTLKTSLKSVPNIIFDDVPLGGEEDSIEIKTWGEKKEKGVDHRARKLRVEYSRRTRKSGGRQLCVDGFRPA